MCPQSFPSLMLVGAFTDIISIPSPKYYLMKYVLSGAEGNIFRENNTIAADALKMQVQYGSRPAINSLAPGKFEWNFKHVMFKQILMIDDWGISCEIALTWKPQDLAEDKLTLVQVMAWCRQAASHYLSQCWPRSMSPNGVTKPQWVKALRYWSRVWTAHFQNGVLEP